MKFLKQVTQEKRVKFATVATAALSVGVVFAGYHLVGWQLAVPMAVIGFAATLLAHCIGLDDQEYDDSVG